MSKRTPFYDRHTELKARMVDFAGYEMPMQYAGIRQEHQAVRERAGLFDVSHMGEFFVTGPEALNLLNKVMVSDLSKLEVGKAKYTAMCYEDGGFIDDLLVYRVADQEYMLVVNAANSKKDLEWLEQQNSMNAGLEDRSDRYALLAIQGPESVQILQKLTDTDLSEIPFYSFKTGNVAGQEMILSATGYTGEKGFELYIDLSKADPLVVWDTLMETGEGLGLEAAGLGARDTLRLEMGYVLYGNDISKETTPVEAKMGWLIDWDKKHFIGMDVLKEQKEAGPGRKLIGFVVEEARSVPRAGYKITDDQGAEIGVVTSGTQSISIGKGIGMGYISAGKLSENGKIYINIRNKKAAATVVNPPFYKK